MSRAFSPFPRSAPHRLRSAIIAGAMTPKTILSTAFALLPVLCLTSPLLHSQSVPHAPKHAVVLRAARLLDIENGKIITPGEVLVQDEHIAEVGPSVKHPPGAELIDLGDTTLLPGLIDAHVHLFLHPGAEDLQTVEESVPQRTISRLSPRAMT